MYKVHAQLFNRRGNHPALEKKPPLKAIADASNLKSDVPAIKAAAEIKQAEDLAPQKIKAIKYLARIGCGCYDKDEKVTKALLAAMEDCTEDVRQAAVEAVAEAAESEYCENCKERSCCNEKIVAMLAKIAYERDDQGCYIEPSERVRQAAIDAMGVCCADSGVPPLEPTPAPIEGIDQPMPIEGGIDMPPPPTVDLEAAMPIGEDSSRLSDSARSASTNQLASSRRTQTGLSLSDRSQGLDGSQVRNAVVEETASEAQTAAPVFKKVTGKVSHVNGKSGLIQLQLDKNATLPAGCQVQVFHQYFSGEELSGLLQVVDSRPGIATARVSSAGRAPRFSKGDTIQAWR